MIPIIKIDAFSPAGAWEKALDEVWKQGLVMPSQHGRTIETTAIINIRWPLEGERISKADMSGYAMMEMGIERAKSSREKAYVKEVMDGSIDHRIGTLTPYTYHERLFNHTWLLKSIDQIDVCIKKIKDNKDSRSIQAITWDVVSDLNAKDAPCLQRIWFRVTDDGLVMQTEWRSRDLFNAWGSNVYAMLELGKYVAESTGLVFNQYVDHSNSLHIYERNWTEAYECLRRINKRVGIDFVSRRVLAYPSLQP